MSYSRLAFGLAGIAGSGSRREQERLLATALDFGITHFDVAPLYGSGDAEAILGEFAVTRRGRMTIATKAGLSSPLASVGPSFARQFARKALKLLPNVKRRLAEASARIRPAGAVSNYSAQALRASAERSLRALRTGHIDVLLLHEWPAAEALREDIGGELSRLVAQGHLGAIGIGSSTGAARLILESGSTAFQVLQFENSLLRPAGELIRGAAATPGKWVITHRALSETLQALSNAMRGSDRRANWEAALGFEPTNGNLSKALLDWALADNPHGTVLFSTRDTGRLRENANLAQQPFLSDETRSRLELLAASVRQEMPSHPST